MLTEQNPEPNSALKNPLVYSSIALGIALIVVGWIFFSRWQQNRGIDQRIREQRTEQQRESDRRAVEQLGGNDFAILMFYASPGIIHRGESSSLCYGVSNAKTVKLDPPDMPVWPSPNRCADVSPKKSTTYTLTIADAAGTTKTQSLEIKVR
jgi:hypothetical protein